jgi:predicted site-specific integrase-resolvase
MAKQQAKVTEINAAILARVSTRDQKDNSSLDGQIATGRKYCAQHGYTIVAERKEIHSGAYVLARSVFAELIDMAADGLIQVIVVDVPDRLGRGDAIAKLEYMVQLNGAHIEYVRGVNNTSTIEGIVLDSASKMLLGIERYTIARRMKDGKRNRIAEGRVIAPARRPYGYRVVSERDNRGRKTSCTFEIVESEARVIRDIYDWCVHEAMTSYAIAKRLNANQIPRMCDTDQDVQKVREKITGKMREGWTGDRVANILRNTVYRGEWRYGKINVQRTDAIGKVKRIIRKNEDENTILAVAVPAIVTDAVWYAAQEQLDENKRKFMHPPVNNYELRGRIRCALCGGAMTGKGESKAKYRAYICAHARKQSGIEAKPCHTGPLDAKIAEAAVWESIRDVMLDPERLWVGVHNQSESNKKARRLLEQAIAAEQAEIDKVQAKETRLLDLYESGDITKQAYRARVADYKAEIERHDAERQRLTERLGECATLTPEQEETLQHFQQEIAARMTDDVPSADRMQLYDLLRVQCIYNSDTGEMLISGLMGEATVSVIFVTKMNGTPAVFHVDEYAALLSVAWRGLYS